MEALLHYIPLIYLTIGVLGVCVLCEYEQAWPETFGDALIFFFAIAFWPALLAIIAVCAIRNHFIKPQEEDRL